MTIFSNVQSYLYILVKSNAITQNKVTDANNRAAAEMF